MTTLTYFSDIALKEITINVEVKKSVLGNVYYKTGDKVVSINKQGTVVQSHPHQKVPSFLGKLVRVKG